MAPNKERFGAIAKTLWLLPFIHINNIPPHRKVTQLSHPLTQLSHREGFYFCFRYNQAKKNFNIQIRFYIKIFFAGWTIKSHKKFANKKEQKEYLINLTEIILLSQKIFPFTGNLFVITSARFKVQAGKKLPELSNTL